MHTGPFECISYSENQGYFVLGEAVFKFVRGVTRNH
jgi:hypothetical protein